MTSNAIEDKRMLLSLGRIYLGEAIVALSSEDYAVLQGALRAVYNGLNSISIRFSLGSEDERQLADLCDDIFHSRDDLITAIECGRKDFGVAVRETNFCDRLKKINQDFRKIYGRLV